MKFSSLLAASVATALLAPATTGQNLLANGDFEAGGLAGWSFFGNAFPQTEAPPQFVAQSGTELCTMFGLFSGGFDVSGIFQEFNCNPGDPFFMDAASRHFSGDALIGAGLPNDNWVVMKIAFFDAFGVEIGPAASEAVILDGTSPTDVWIDNSPITASAPVGAAKVQALVLFLQPNDDGGAAHIDDVVFLAGSPNKTYPGGGEDVALSSGLNGSSIGSGGGFDVVNVIGGDLLELNVSSPGGTFDLSPYFLVGQTFVTGNPPLPLFDVYINLGLPYFLLVNGAPTPIGSPLIVPGGDSSFFQIPPGLAGFSFMTQAFPISPLAANGVYAASDGVEIVFN